MQKAPREGAQARLEQYDVREDLITREISVGGRRWRSSIENKSPAEVDGYSAWWQSFLRGGSVNWLDEQTSASAVRTVDAFCGCGGLTLGATQAALAVGRRLEAAVAVDVDNEGLAVHRHNFRTQRVLHGSVSSLVDFHVAGAGAGSMFSYEPEVIDAGLAAEIGRTDLFLAGPPCQGHSNLNNKTRREDPRNLLYLTAIALAVALRARMIAIENVPEVVNDRSEVVAASKALLQRSGYGFIDSGVLAAHEIGWSQSRRRYFLLASRQEPDAGHLTLKDVAARMKRAPLPLRWAIEDLAGLHGSSLLGVMNTVPELSVENRDRIKWLFENNSHELPNQERPDCHKDGHSYPSVYGRMYWDRPAQTITTGFLTPGRGRYVHPILPRVITPREAARIQAFPDSFKFIVDGQDPTRFAVSKWIGDAVPPILGYAALLPLLTAF